MAGTKRASESVDSKSSKKLKPIKDFPNKAKSADDSEDLAAFDEEPQQDGSNKNKHIKRHDSDAREGRTDTRNQETFLNGKSDYVFLLFFPVIDHAASC